MAHPFQLPETGKPCGALLAALLSCAPWSARGAETVPAPTDDYRPAPTFAQQTRAPAPATASRFKVEVLASGLDHPWSLAFLPDGELLVTERPGRLRRIARDGTVSAPIDGVPAVKAFAAEGLHDVVVDRHFAKNRTLYLSYFAPLPKDDVPPTLDAWVAWLRLPAGQHESHPFGVERIARARLSPDGQRLEDFTVILEGADRRIVQGPAGDLFIEAAPPAGGGIPVDDEPQRLENTYGKVLRVTTDGKPVRGNPFTGRAAVRPEIYAYGLRDMEGGALHPRSGLLWTCEHGPRGGDEINIVRPGRNYGFPVISYGREYAGTLINGGLTAKAGLEQPVYFWTPSIGPSGLAFYRGSLLPAWKQSLFVGSLIAKKLIRLELDGDRVVAEESLLADRGKRIRDVRTGPDGAVYVLTDEKDGELLRLSPPDPSPPTG